MGPGLGIGASQEPGLDTREGLLFAQEFPDHFLFELMFPLLVLAIFQVRSDIIVPMRKEWVCNGWKVVHVEDRLMDLMIDNVDIRNL